MGPGHFENGELNQPTEHAGQNITDMESERPSPSEVPQLDYNVHENGTVPDWKAEDSEREFTELPQLEKSETTQETKTDAGPGQPTASDVSAENRDVGEKQDVENQYYSTYEERLKQTPKEDSDRGEWSGGRGESEFTPNDEEVQDILNQHNKESIAYEDAIPDFSEVAESTVEIDNMTENRADNFRQCDEKCAEQWNKEGRDGRTDWTARDVKEWRQENGYSWHERNDMKTCDLIPTKVNDYFGHLGGVSECKKRDAGNGGSDFDE